MIIIYHGHMDETENTSRSERFLSYIPKHLFKVPINFRNASCSGWAQYIDQTVRTQLLFSFGTSDSFLAGLGRNRVYGACCSAQPAYKSVQQSRQPGLRAYLNISIYCLVGAQLSNAYVTHTVASLGGYNNYSLYPLLIDRFKE